MGMLCLCRRVLLQVCCMGLLLGSLLVTISVAPAACNGYELPQCSDGWITVDETASHTFTCTGIRSDNVSWIVTDTVSSTELGHCEPLGTCKSDSSTGVSQITRVFDKTELTIHAYLRATFSGKTLICTDGNGRKADCALKFIHRASIGPCNVGVTADWSVTGSCQIDKVFSSRDDYRCLWYTSLVNQPEQAAVISGPVFHKSSFTESGLQYFRGHCNFTLGFPSEEGVYTYIFSFDPRPTEDRKKTLMLEPPGWQPFHNCPRYVAEGSPLVCDCGTTRPGKPPAVLSWGADSQIYRLRLDNVRRHQNGTVYTCSRAWGRGVQTHKYTLQVAYGTEDKDLSIPGPSTFLADGSRPLRLFCQASNTNPTPQYEWTGVTCNEGGSSSTCSFTPRVPEDEGKVVTCIARNTGMSTDIKTATAIYNVRLNYRPTKMVITGYNSSDVLIAGDSVSLTCTVSGGKPPVTGINFYCKRQDNTVINGFFYPASSSSTVTIDVLRDGDNGTGCTCDTKGYWPPDPGHSLEEGRRLTVVDRPSKMVLTGYNSGDVLIAGDSVSLTCTVVGGKPPVTDITFYCKRQDNTRINGTFDPVSSSSTVTIDVLRDGDNGTGCNCDTKGYWPPDPSHSLKEGRKLTVVGALPTVSDQVNISAFPVATVAGATGGAVGLLLLVAIVVVIVQVARRHKDTGKVTSDGLTSADGEVLEEHVNIMYMSSGAELTSPSQHGHASKPSPASSALSPDSRTKNRNTPANRPSVGMSSDYTYVDVDGETVKGAASHRGNHDDSSAYADVDGYSSVRVSRAGVGGTAKKPGDDVDEYDVVSGMLGRKPTQGRSDVYDHLVKNANEVDKSSKRKAEGTVPAREKMGTEPNLCAHAQKPLTNAKPKPAVKPKPHQTYRDAPDHSANCDNYEDVGALQMEVSPEAKQEAEQEDEYNTLSHKPASPDHDAEYSHIGDV